MKLEGWEGMKYDKYASYKVLRVLRKIFLKSTHTKEN